RSRRGACRGFGTACRRTQGTPRASTSARRSGSRPAARPRRPAPRAAAPASSARSAPRLARSRSPPAPCGCRLLVHPARVAQRRAALLVVLRARAVAARAGLWLVLARRLEVAVVLGDGQQHGGSFQ